MKKPLILLFLFLYLQLYAPIDNRTILFLPEEINPFKAIFKAVAEVESLNDVFAFNLHEQAMGPFQIRPVRLLDFNQRTGKNYTHADCFDYEKSKEIFLYYASKIGPYDFERIAKAWNGSGPKTIEYWKKVKAKL